MKKKILSMAMAVVTAISCFTITAIATNAAVASSSDFTFNADKGEITKYIGAGGDVVIPSEINGVAVKAIGEAFSGNLTVTSVVIPDSVGIIWASAFDNCENLKTVKIGNGVRRISSGAFINCKKLTDVTFGNSLITVDMGAFAACENLNTVIIPASVTSLGWSAFDGAGLTSVVFQSQTPPDFDNDVFKDCKLEKIIVPVGAEQSYKHEIEFKDVKIIEHNVPCSAKNCGICFPRILGDIEGKGEPTIGGVLEILKFLAGMDSSVKPGTNAFEAARITSQSAPVIADVLEILKYLAGMDSALRSTHSH
jgi:hypothetical protein